MDSELDRLREELAREKAKPARLAIDIIYVTGDEYDAKLAKGIDFDSVAEWIREDCTDVDVTPAIIKDLWKLETVADYLMHTLGHDVEPFKAIVGRTIVEYDESPFYDLWTRITDAYFKYEPLHHKYMSNIFEV